VCSQEESIGFLWKVFRKKPLLFSKGFGVCAGALYKAHPGSIVAMSGIKTPPFLLAGLRRFFTVLAPSIEVQTASDANGR
jgi:hypothetical protein